MLLYPDLCGCIFFLDGTNANTFIPEKSVACADHETLGIVETYASYEAARLTKIKLIKAATTIAESSPSMLETNISTPRCWPEARIHSYRNLERR